jgi:hypothetical protein
MQIKNLISRKYDTESLSEISLTLIQAINSSIMFLTTFFGLLIINQAMTSIAASAFGISNTLRFSEVNFDLYRGNWGRLNVIGTFGAGPLVCLMIGMFALIVFNRIQRSKGHLKMFALWTVLNGFNLFFGAMIIGVITHSGFGYVPAWASKNEYIAYGVGAFCVLPLLGLGIIAGSPFLQLIPRLDLLEPEECPQFCFSVIFGPFLMAFPIVFAVFLPGYSLYTMGLLLTTSIMLFPAYLIARAPRTQSTGIARQTEISVAWNYAGVFLGLLLFGKYLEVFGINFIFG